MLNSRGRKKMTSTAAWKRAKDLTFVVLQAASDAIEICDAARGRYAPILLHQGLEGVKRVKSEEYRRDIVRRARELRRRGLLEARRTGSRLRYSLTQQGEASLLKEAIRRSPLREDRRSVLVMFDVPEREKLSRECLRNMLKRSGFTRLQQSVWATRKDAAPILTKWVILHDLQEWVHVALVERLD